MTWSQFTPERPAVEVDAGEAWARSGGQWLSAEGSGVPVTLVETVVAAVTGLDDRGAGLADAVGEHGVGLVGERAALLGFSPSGVVGCGGATRLLRCRDGWMALSLPRPEDVESVPALLGRVARSGTDVWSELEATLSGVGCAEVVDRAVLLGLAAAVPGETEDDRAVLLDRIGDAHPTALRGLVVANLGSLWAAPLAGDVLARLGARVIKIESTARPDGSRATPRFHAALNGRCESVGLDLRRDTDRRRLRELLSAVDVVIEGSRPRALEQMGIEARSLLESGPRLWLSVTGHGRSGPPAERIGFGDDAAVAGGLTGELDGRPVFVADAVADPLAGVLAAEAVTQLAERGGRWLVDVALARAAASVAGPLTRPATTDPCPPRARRDGAIEFVPLGRHTRGVLADLGVG